MKKLPYLLIFLFGCVGEDYVMDEVDPEVRITNPIVNMEINTSYQFEYMLLNNAGMETTPDEISWSTSDASIAIINQQGMATALDYGEVEFTLTATLDDSEITATILFVVSDDPTSSTLPTRSGMVNTTTSYDLSGDFTVSKSGTDLVIAFDENYIADTGLPGLYVYLTNNPNSPDGGYEIGAVQIFSGAHQYTLPNIGLYDYNYLFYYCKPFKVKVGHGEIE